VLVLFGIRMPPLLDRADAERCSRRRPRPGR
jgi:hypothetical protein